MPETNDILIREINEATNCLLQNWILRLFFCRGALAEHEWMNVPQVFYTLPQKKLKTIMDKGLNI